MRAAELVRATAALLIVISLCSMGLVYFLLALLKRDRPRLPGRVGLGGCLLGSSGAFTCIGWWNDPCILIVTLLLSTVLGIWGIAGWPSLIDEVCRRFERGLINSPFGIDAQWFFQGAVGVPVMGPGYGLFVSAVVFIILAAAGAVLLCMPLRALRFAELEFNRCACDAEMFSQAYLGVWRHQGRPPHYDSAAAVVVVNPVMAWGGGGGKKPAVP
jgi:hypothetical protein